MYGFMSLPTSGILVEISVTTQDVIFMSGVVVLLVPGFVFYFMAKYTGSVRK